MEIKRNKKGQFIKGNQSWRLVDREKIAAKLRGQKRTPEQIERMREAQKKYWANPKNHNELLRRSKIGAYISSQRKGEKNPCWKGGKYKMNGYIMVLVGDKYIPEHRYIIEKYLNRKLEKYEHIHHLNGIKDDNRLENLKIVINRKHYGEIKCPKCQYEFLIK